MTKTERLKERIELSIVEQVNTLSRVAQKEPENYLPQFIKNLTEKILEITLDEITYSRR